MSSNQHHQGEPVRGAHAPVFNIRRTSRTPARLSLDRFINENAYDGKTLDLGCGPSPYASLFPNRVAADFTAQAGVDVKMDAHSLPFGLEQFDLVLCTEMLEHVPEPSQVIAEIGRVLKPGGTCILTTRFCYPIHDAPHDYYRFTHYSLRYLFRDWNIAELSADTTVPETLYTLAHYAVHQHRGFLGSPLRMIWFLCGLMQRAYSAREDRQRVPVDGMRLAAGYHLVARKRSTGVPRGPTLCE